MTHFLSFAIPGIPYGFVYALVAVGLVLVLTMAWALQVAISFTVRMLE